MALALGCGSGSSLTAADVDSAASDAGAKTSPSPIAFDKTVLDADYRAEGVGVFDVDRDGSLDIVTDQYWYAGPTFAKHEIRAAETYDPATAFADDFAIYPQDVDGDGWNDIIVAPQRAVAQRAR